MNSDLSHLAASLNRSLANSMGRPISSGLNGRLLAMLDLTSANIDDKQAAHLAQGIQDGELPSLRNLKIHSTILTQQGVNDIMRALKTDKNPQLFSIDMQGRFFTHEDVVAHLPDLRTACRQLTWVNNENILQTGLYVDPQEQKTGPESVVGSEVIESKLDVPPEIQSQIDKINQVLSNGILNGQNAAKKGLIISTSSDRVAINPEDYSSQLYAYSTYKDVLIDSACTKSISIAIERTQDGLFANQELELGNNVAKGTEDETRLRKFQAAHEDKRIPEFNLEKAKTLIIAKMPTFIPTACWTMRKSQMIELERRAHQTVLFITSSQTIKTTEGLVSDLGIPAKNPELVLEISTDRLNEIPQLGLNIRSAAIDMIIVPEHLHPYRSLINHHNVQFVQTQVQEISYIFNLTTNTGSPDFAEIKNLSVPVPAYNNCDALIDYTRTHDYTITHMSRLE